VKVEAWGLGYQMMKSARYCCLDDVTRACLSTFSFPKVAAVRAEEILKRKTPSCEKLKVPVTDNATKSVVS
jgi:hypothetical protein